MKTAACYIRVSTDEQTEYSPDSQLKVIRDYAFKHDISLLEEYIFAEDGGKSGKNMAKRTEFMRLISLTKKKPKPFDIILVWKFSRFARNQEESIVLKSMLKKNDIDVVSVSESLPEGPFGSLVERIIEWSDEYYLINLAQEVKRGMKERASRGLPVCPPPIGYDMKDGQYVPNSNAEYVKNIFSDYLNGMGVRTIAIKYGRLGLRTVRGNEPDNRCIEYMLRNPVYTGKIRWSVDGRAASRRVYDDPNTMITDGMHKPIISEEMFNKVQDKLNETKKLYSKYQRSEEPVEFMLKGLLRCSICGATLVARNTKGKMSLQCHNYNRGSCKVSHSIQVDTANLSVIQALENAVETGEFNISPPKKEKTSTIDYDKLIQNEYFKLERIKEAYQSGVDTLEEYKRNKAQITAFIEKLNAEKAADSAAATVDKELIIKKLIAALAVIKDPAQPEDAKNRSLRSVVEKIIYDKKTKSLDIFFYA